MRKMSKGLTLLETMISVVILAAFVVAGMSLYAASINETKRSEAMLCAAWLAKGKLDSAPLAPVPDKPQTFSAPFGAYAYSMTKTAIPGDDALAAITVNVTGPDGADVTLQRLIPVR